MSLFYSAVDSKSYCVVKNLMWNVRIKAFWYTKVVICYCITYVLAVRVNQKIFETGMKFALKAQFSNF